MAKGEEEKTQHTAAEKGKGKATDSTTSDGVNGQDGKKDKDGKIVQDGKDKGKSDEGQHTTLSLSAPYNRCHLYER